MIPLERLQEFQLLLFLLVFSPGVDIFIAHDIISYEKCHEQLQYKCMLETMVIMKVMIVIFF